MELIGSCECMGCMVEAYFPESGAEDIWTIWVIVDGRIVAESTLRIEVGSAYGVDERVLHQLEQSAEVAVESYLRTQIVDEYGRNARRSLSSVLPCGAQPALVQRHRTPIAALETGHLPLVPGIPSRVSEPSAVGSRIGQ